MPVKADKVHLRHIFIAFQPTQADRDAAYAQVETARNEIAAADADFEDIAKRYASKQNPTSQAGILIEATTEELDRFPEVFQNVLENLDADEISEGIEGNEGIYLFRVEKKDDKMIAFRYLIVPLEMSPEAIQAARERSVEVFKKLENGEDFDTLAATYSDDTETREKGGMLGVRSLGELNPETRRIIETLAAGAYSNPHETESGLHIFRVDERNTPDLSEAEKQQITGILRQQRFQEEWDAYTDSLIANAYIKINLKE